MKKIIDDLFTIANDEDKIAWIKSFMLQFPSKDGYKIEIFMSPITIRIKVYK